MNTQENIASTYRNKQEKYIYYTIALAVTAIGFSIFSTQDKALSYIQIPLGVAIIVWSISVYLGLKFLALDIITLHMNADYLRLLDTIEQETSAIKKEDYNNSVKQIMEKLEANSRKGESLIDWKEKLLFSGAILFFIWHVLRMYNYN